MTSGAQLDHWCRQNGVKAWAGTFCSDTLPPIYRPDDWCCIVNHSPCDSPSGGTHWLACRIQDTKAFWFDSFGFPPYSPLENELMGHAENPYFLPWLKASGVSIPVTYNERDMQGVTGDECGLYAAYFCKHGMPAMNRGAWSFLSASPSANDKAIQSKVRIPLDK